MADASLELMHEFMKKLNQRFDKVDNGLSELRAEMSAMRGTVISIQQDIHNIYGIMARHDQRLDRIENRLDLREFSEAAQRPLDPSS